VHIVAVYYMINNNTVTTTTMNMTLVAIGTMCIKGGKKKTNSLKMTCQQILYHNQ